jgi:hypothetical protein
MEDLSSQLLFSEVALLHSGLDGTKCLHTGLGSNMNDGTRMVVVNFYYKEESVYAASDTSLCMAYRQVSANVDVDPIIMKEYEESQDPFGMSLTCCCVKQKMKCILMDE